MKLRLLRMLQRRKLPRNNFTGNAIKKRAIGILPVAFFLGLKKSPFIPIIHLEEGSFRRGGRKRVVRNRNGVVLAADKSKKSAVQSGRTFEQEDIGFG